MALPSVYELDLPTLDTTGMERVEALSATAEARRQHWLARSPLGFSMTGYEDAVGVLRDRRFHSALSEWKPATFGIWGPSRLPLRFEALAAPY
jgi:hypothetical protein